MSGPEEVTIKHGTNQWDLVFSELREVKKLCSDSYGMAQETQSIVRGLVPRVEYLEKRDNAREVSHNWAPLLISCLSLGLTFWLALHHG
jgi:hypothetical protein